MRGSKTPEATRAAITAALLCGYGVCETARRLRISHSIVSEIKSSLPPDILQKVRERRGEAFEELLADYLTASLKALIAQAEVASDQAWLQKQPAGEFAALYGVMADRTLFMLELSQRASFPPDTPAE